MIIKILESNYEEFKKEANKIQKKCEKYNCAFSVEYIETVRERVNSARFINDSYVSYMIFDVIGHAVINDWKFIASIDHHENGNVVNSFEDVSDVDFKYYYRCEPKCEHCNTNRDRKYTCIIRNIKTGEYKQVGKSCLKDYTSGMDIAVISKMFDFVDNAGIEYGNNEEEFFSKDVIYKVSDIVMLGLELINKIGYISNSKAMENGTMSTSKFATKFFTGGVSEIDRKFLDKVNFNWQYGTDEDIKSKTEKIIEYIKNLDVTDNYTNNLTVIFGNEFTELKYVGYIMAGISKYNRDNDIVNEKENNINSNFVGNVGDKIEFTATDIKILTSWQTEYGTTYLTRFIDDKGNIYIWKTSKCIATDKLGTYKATVKEHKEYENIKQTVVLRCKKI